ncbi:hypothetical protein [Streptomyces olivaceiscleroticus]|uniref:Uncharacterized protein n=1 Tax=Streptomyces olivaceiscleroticus TaxID=68245 RepID=A0ABP3K1Y1_9ACTN
MLTETFMAVAAAGGTALAQAAGTDAWGTLRAGVARLCGRGDPQRERAELERLDRTATAVESAGQGDEDGVRIAEGVSWRTRFELLLESLPEEERAVVAVELQALLDERAGRGRQEDGAVSGNTFHGPTAFQVGDGNHQVNHFTSEA